MATWGGFDWDDTKAASNEAKHGVSFDDAVEVFDDPGRVELLDERKSYGERRLLAVGLVDGVPVTVVYTARGSARRIISARRASRAERRMLSERSWRPVTDGDRP